MPFKDNIPENGRFTNFGNDTQNCVCVEAELWCYLALQQARRIQGNYNNFKIFIMRTIRKFQTAAMENGGQLGRLLVAVQHGRRTTAILCRFL
jgi:hypothetical protein